MQVWHQWQLKKIKILGAVLELPAKQHCQFSLFSPFSRQMGWFGSAVKTVPRILISSIAMGADY
jgi:hypothetical protein